MNLSIRTWPLGGGPVGDIGAAPICANSMSVASNAVYAVEDSKIVAFPLDGSGPQELVSGPDHPSNVVSEPNGTAIYWADWEAGEIDRLDITTF